jgi:hypothetical protein
MNENKSQKSIAVNSVITSNGHDLYQNHSEDHDAIE